MSRCSAAVPVLLAGACLLACGGVDDPQGEPASPRAGAGGAGQQLPAGGADQTGTAPPSAGDPADTDSSDTLLPDAQPTAADHDALSPQPVFCDAPTKVLVASCGNGSCHSNPGAAMGDFAVDATRAYNFVDKTSTRHAYCGRIIDSQDYSKSLLLTKVRGTFPTTDCGGRMPVGSFKISDDQINCLASWLQQFQR